MKIFKSEEWKPESKQTCKWTPGEYWYETQCGFIIHKDQHLISKEGVAIEFTYCPNCGHEIERSE